jgi:hypothetical protein
MSRAQRLQLLLVLACAAGAAALAASEFMDTFELTSPGGEATQSSEASDRHNYALLVLAAFALGALVVALLAGSQVAYFAVAVAGVVALLIFLIGDLPDVNKIGPLDNAREPFVDAQAEPQAGFWLELFGSLLLTVGGIALAMLRTPAPREQLAEPGRAELPAAPPPVD